MKKLTSRIQQFTQFRYLAILEVAESLFVFVQLILRFFAVVLRRTIFLVRNTRTIGQNVVETVHINFARNFIFRR